MERNFVVALPMLYYRDLIDYQIITQNIFEIDQTIKEIRSFDEVKTVKSFMPCKAMIKREWILSEIDKKNINHISIKVNPFYYIYFIYSQKII